MKEIITGDAFEVLPRLAGRGAVITSPPDAEEIGESVETWADWFVHAAALCFSAAAGPVVFYVTDRKSGGRLFSKPALIAAAAPAGYSLMWHKIALRKPAGATDLHRPGYTHLVAYNTENKPGRATPDVFERGPVAYKNGMGLRAASVAVRYAADFTDTVIDPFCGRGTVPAMAGAYGLDGYGIEILEDQAARARALNISRV